MASGYHPEQCKYKIFPSLQKEGKSACQNDTGANLKELQWLDLEKLNNNNKKKIK